MEGTEVNCRDVRQSRAVHTEDTRVQEVGVASLVEEALVADGDHVVLVDGLDERRDILSPGRDSGGGAGARSRAGRSRTARLVHELLHQSINREALEVVKIRHIPPRREW